MTQMLHNLISKFILTNTRWHDLDYHHKGIFLQLLMYASMNNNKIPNSTREIKSYFKTAKNIQKAIVILSNFFQLSSNGKYYYSPLWETIELELKQSPFEIQVHQQPPVFQDLDDVANSNRADTPINIKMADVDKYKEIVSFTYKQLKTQIVDELQGIKLEYALALLDNDHDKVALMFHRIDRSNGIPPLLAKVESSYFSAQEQLYNLKFNPNKNDNGTD